MIYDNLRFRDRLLRAIIGATLGGGLGFLLMLRGMRGNLLLHSRSAFLLPATCVGALIGGFLAFRRKRV
jgi:hypothetical protein